MSTSDTSSPGPPQPASDPAAVIRSRAYLSALVLAALLGIPISAIAYGFLALVSKSSSSCSTTCPATSSPAARRPGGRCPWLVLCGLLTGLTIRYLPGNGGHSPAFGFKTGGGRPSTASCPAIVLAVVRHAQPGRRARPRGPADRDRRRPGGADRAPASRRTRRRWRVTIMASAGSFAAISTLLGSPLLGAFLIMEAAGIAGATLSLVALPGLLASGIGALVFVGLDNWTGLGTFSLALTSVPPEVDPDGGDAGLGGGHGRRRRAARLGDPVDRAVAAPGRAPEPGAGDRVPRPARRPDRDDLPAGLRPQLHPGAVLRSGRPARRWSTHAADYSIGVLLLLAACKTLAYGLSLSAFRGGPVFPAMFIGAVLGIAACRLPGMELAPAIGIGIGAMCAAMLRLPLTSTLLATLLLGADGPHDAGGGGRRRGRLRGDHAPTGPHRGPAPGSDIPEANLTSAEQGREPGSRPTPLGSGPRVHQTRRGRLGITMSEGSSPARPTSSFGSPRTAPTRPCSGRRRQVWRHALTSRWTTSRTSASPSARPAPWCSPDAAPEADLTCRVLPGPPRHDHRGLGRVHPHRARRPE